jgi:hypothetical protein
MSLELHCVGRGIGGVDECGARARDDVVSFGLVRLCVGRGTFARWKSVFVHFNPEGASVVKRGRANAMKRAVEVRASDARDVCARERETRAMIG